MELALKEVKTQAKKLLKSLKANNNTTLATDFILQTTALTSLEQVKLKQCLTIVANQLGFENWHHIQEILSGSKQVDKPLNMGTLFYPKGCGGFINEWFVDYQQAQKTLIDCDSQKWLLPYKNQFIVVKEDYIVMFNLNEKTKRLWPDIGYNLVKGYKSLAWDKVVCEIIKNRPRDY